MLADLLLVQIILRDLILPESRHRLPTKIVGCVPRLTPAAVDLTMKCCRGPNRAPTEPGRRFGNAV